MERFFKPKVGEASSSKTPEYVDVESLPPDPADRKPLSSYNPNQRDEIRREYLLRGPCQPSKPSKSKEFPQTKISQEMRRFNISWYACFPGWLEYSEKNDSVYCLCCYLFKGYFGDQKDAFVSKGFKNWKQKDGLDTHEGKVNSVHNKCLKKCDDLLNGNQSIRVAFVKQDSKKKYEYRLRLSASTRLSKRLLNQGLAFRARDESDGSLNKGNYLELLELMGEVNEELGKVILKNAPGNNKLTSPMIQQDFKHCYAQEVLKQIFEDLNGDVFSLLVDESSDV